MTASKIVLNRFSVIGSRETLPFSIRRAIGRVDAESFHNKCVSLSPSGIRCCHRSSGEEIPNSAPSAIAIITRRNPSL